jgi:hypothetical protein
VSTDKELQLADSVNRIRTIMQELNGKRSLQALLVADLLAALLAHCKEELRERTLEHVVEWARNMIPINERSREEDWPQQRQ